VKCLLFPSAKYDTYFSLTNSVLFNHIAKGASLYMNDLISQEIIEQKIIFIRNQKVMIDRDLAVLYGVKQAS